MFLEQKRPLTEESHRPGLQPPEEAVAGSVPRSHPPDIFGSSDLQQGLLENDANR